MQTIFSQELVHRIESSGVVAVLVIDDPADAVPVAKALWEGGVSAMELALRTPRSLEALVEIRKGMPEMLAGVGTILFPEQVTAAQEAGAAFGVSPGIQQRIMEEAVQRKFPFAPGIATPSELELALCYGCRNVKLFPAESLGGMSYVEAIYAPYMHLGVRFIPLGGLHLDNLASYLAHPAILAAGGSWLAPRKLIQAKKWDVITENTVKAIEIVKKNRQ